MRYRKTRRFRHRSNGRGHQSRTNSGEQIRFRSNSFSNDRGRNNFNPSQGAEKLAEGYNDLAKKALTSGDKILAESYLQYADHFLRIINEKKLNQNQNQNKAQIDDEKKIINKNPPHDNEFSQGQGVEEKKE